VFSGTVEAQGCVRCWLKWDDLQRPRGDIFGNLHSCCLLPNVMVPWHVVMSKAEYGHNAGELRRVRHYLSAQTAKP